MITFTVEHSLLEIIAVGLLPLICGIVVIFLDNY